MRISEKMLLGLILAVLISGCEPAPLEIIQTAAPTVTATLIPLIRPTPTATPTPVINLGIDQPIEIWIFGSRHNLKVIGASEELKYFTTDLLIGSIEPTEGNKLIIVYYEISDCSRMLIIDPVVVDETGQVFGEGFYTPDSDVPLSLMDCRTWVFGVDMSSQHFTLLMPANVPTTSTTRWYEIDLDQILEPLDE